MGKSLSRSFCLLAVSVLISSFQFAADPVPVRFESLSVEDGMLQNALLGLHEDSRGFLWIASEFGLNVYNGYTFSHITQDPTKPHSLSHPIIFDIAEDRKGRLWIATQNGLNRFDHHTWRITHLPLDPQNPDDIDRNWVSRLLLDQDGTLWVGTWGRGLIRFDPETFTITDRHRANQGGTGGISNNFITSMYQDRYGDLWIGTRNGLNRFNPVTGEFTHFLPPEPSLLGRVVRSMTEDAKGRFWIGSLEGLWLLDPQSGLFASPFGDDPAAAWLESQRIFALAEDPHGSLWVGTRNGLARIDSDTLEVIRYRHIPGESSGLIGNNISDLLMDSNGLLWVATYGQGLNKIVFQTKPFRHYAYDPDNPRGLSHPSLLGMAEDKAGFLWIGTRGGGLNRLDPTTGRCRHYSEDPGNADAIISNDIPIVIQSEVEPNVLWFGARGGLDRFDRETERFTHFRNDPDREGSLSHNLVYALLEDRDGTLWVGTWGGGLNRFDRNTQTFTRYRADRRDGERISSDTVWVLFEDSSSRLWVGTGGGGLNRMDPVSGTFRAYRNKPGDASSLSNDFIFSIQEDSAGSLWIGTLGGLNRFDPETGRCERYTTEEGLPDNLIYGILEDDQGDLWLSTNKGLSRFDPVQKTFRNYSPLDGLQANEFNMHSHWKNRQGELYFGGVAGLNVFKPMEIRDNQCIPKVVFTDFRIFNHPVTIDPGGGSPLKSSITTAETITLSHRQHSISFQFSALDFTHPKRNQYAYMLEGVDEDWIYTGNKREITFAHLSPGEYTLRVKATNSDGVWNEQGVSIRIIVNPPFWKTWWFRGLLILLALLLTLVWHRTRMSRMTHLLKSEAAMERFFNLKGISPREREIILLILAGKSNKQIEDDLFISLGTVKNHVFNIYRKLDVNSRVTMVNLFKKLPFD